MPKPSTSSKNAVQVEEGTIDAFLGEPFMEATRVFDFERHPNIVVTTKGTVIATLGNSELRVRRSEDGGQTWGQEITVAKGYQGGGAIVDEVTGDVLLFVEDSHPPSPGALYRSRDDGKTWTREPLEIAPDSNHHVPSLSMNERGITLRYGRHAGRLVRAARYYAGSNEKQKWPGHYTTAIYSDDRGKTWHTSRPFAETGTGEAALVELADGRLYYNSRAHWNERRPPYRRRCAWSDDGGATWRDWQEMDDVLPDGERGRSYGCFAGLVRLPIKGEDILLYSNCDSYKGRQDGTIWVSFDGGKTWPLFRLIHKGVFEYSSLAAGLPGTPSEGAIFLHFESKVAHTERPHYYKGESMVARFNLSWLLGGRSTGYGYVPDLR